MVLELRGLWGLVDGTTTKPDPAAAADDIAEWNLKDREARAQIALTLKDEPLNSVLTAKTAKGCWEKLSARYDGEGEQRIVHLIDEVFRATLSDTEPLEPQINSLIRAARTITTLGLTLEDKLVAFAIISSLPPTLTTLKIVLSTSSATTISSEYMKSQVILDEQRRVRDSGVGVTAFFAKVSKKGKVKKKSEDKAAKHCTHCNIRGHNISECRKLKKEQEGKASSTSQSRPGQSTASARVAVADTTSSEATVQLFMAHAEPPPPYTVHAFRGHPTPTLQLDLLQHWIIDSGASRTMSCHREWFSHFTPLASPIPVVLGDDSSIVASGVGRIHVEMRANGAKHHSVLQDVLYVPGLQGNLLSVGQLLRNGAKIRFLDQRCELTNAHGVLTCTGQLRSTLFFMDMRTVPRTTSYIASVASFPAEGDDPPMLPQTALATRTSSSKADLDLWHR
jgi:hypothetical protein